MLAAVLTDEDINRVAVADLGSQAFRLEVAEVDNDGVISSLYRERRPLMLARRGVLNEGDIQEVIGALKAFSRIAGQYDADLRVAATAIFRQQPDDVQRSLQEKSLAQAGVELRILSTREEAAYSLRGSAGSMGLTSRFLHLEIGGGSCQISLGEGTQLIDTVSVPAGAGSLTRWVEGLREEECRDRAGKLREHTRSLLIPVRTFAGQARIGVGTGGTAKTLARMESVIGGRGEPVHRPIFLTRKGLETILGEIGSWSCPSIGANRFNLTRDRAEVLMAGTVLVGEAMDVTGLNELEICQDGIRAGLMRTDQDAWVRRQVR